jgi:general secretion pathway protein F
MPLYAYKGVNAAGKAVAGVRDADSPKTVRQLLRKDGVVVLDVAAAKGGKAAASAGAARGAAAPAGSALGREVQLGDLFGGIKKPEVAAFTRQLSTLLKAGIPLSEALGALHDQIENLRLKEVVGRVRTAVNEGSSLADALAKHPRVYDDLYVSMTRAGEVAGNLDDVLTRLADFMEASAHLKSKVQGAMVYPIIMLVVGTLIMGILMVAVVPNITAIFEQQDKALPLNTEMLIWVSRVLGNYWYLLLIFGGLFGWLFVRWKRSDTGRPVWHAFVLKLPLFGPLIRQVAVSRFARTLGTMLASGVTMLRALDVSKETLGNAVLMKIVEDARESIAQGESIAQTLKRSGHFPAMMTHMIAVGERAGQLENMLFRVADTFDREVEYRLGRLTTMIEPLMLVVMGGAVGFVVFSILMPIMDMSDMAF